MHLILYFAKQEQLYSFFFAEFAFFKSFNFLDMGIADLIDSFKDVQKVLHGFFSLFEEWYVEDYKLMRKIADLGISLKRHVFVDNCQCAEFLKFISQVNWLLLAFSFVSFLNNRPLSSFRCNSSTTQLVITKDGDISTAISVL